MQPNRFTVPWNSIALFFITGILLLLALGMVRPMLLLPTHYLIWSNEGWNAGHVARFLAGNLLYTAPDDLATNNYPPLSFLFMAPFGAAGLDLIFSGRVMALLAWLASGALVFMCALRMGASKLGAGLGTLILLATIARFFPYYIAMYEPQWLAHAIMLLGLYVFLGTKDNRGTIIAVMIMIIAGLTKHNILAVPLACFAWLLFTDRKRFFVAFLAAAVGGILALAFLHFTFGTNFWFNLFNARELSWFHFTRKAEHILSIIVPLVAWLIFSVRNKAATTEPRALLVHLLIGASILEFLAFASGVGVAANVVFDMIIAASLAVAFMANRLHVETDIKPAFAVLTLFLFIQLAAWPTMKYLAVAVDPQARAKLVARNAEIDKTIDALKAIDGNAWCEQPAICYWAGKPYTYDDFNTEQRLATGKITLEQVRARMDTLGVKALQIDDPKLVPSEPSTYGESTLAPLTPSFNKKTQIEGGFGVIWSRN